MIIKQLRNFNKIIIFNIKFNNGRQEGIRTLESLHFTRVPGVLLQPLGHLSN